MTIKTWEQLIPTISHRLPQCPTFTMEDELRRAAETFYTETRAWRVHGVTIVAATVASQADYTVTNPSNTELVGLPAVYVNGNEVDETVPGEQPDYPPGYTSDDFSVGVVGAAAVRCTPAPKSGSMIVKATVAYRPGPAATGVEDYLWADHWKAISDLALARLMAQVSKPWSNALMVPFYEAEYQREALRWGSAAGPVRRHRLRVKAA